MLIIAKIRYNVLRCGKFEINGDSDCRRMIQTMLEISGCESDNRSNNAFDDENVTNKKRY